jgi:glycosyltransferase involved in cell wall biosynthesis
MQAATSLAAMAAAFDVFPLGPGRLPAWPLHGPVPELPWTGPPRPRRWPLWERVSGRFWPGHRVWENDRHLGQWAANEIQRLRPDFCYAFTQVALETLRWAREVGAPTVLDNPNGHIRNFAEVYRREAEHWCKGPHRGHPSAAMVARVEQEYALADWIRVSSEWARRSLIRGGVPAERIGVLDQLINLVRFQPPAERLPPAGPLRLCYVGSLDLRKGFVYLLRAMRRAGAGRFELQIVGATGDPGSKALFARERRGLAVTVAAGDPRPAYHRAELFVLPSLEDGFGFVAAEALACGLPVLLTDQCGAAEWVVPGQSGWVVPAGSADALAAALDAALRRRHELPDMGRVGRSTIEARAARDPATALTRWLQEALLAQPAANLSVPR